MCKTQAVFDFLRPVRPSRPVRPVEVNKGTEVFRTTLTLGINKLMARITFFDVLKRQIFEQNDGISSEILPSFITEAVEDRGVTFNQFQGS